MSSTVLKMCAKFNKALRILFLDCNSGVICDGGFDRMIMILLLVCQRLPTNVVLWKEMTVGKYHTLSTCLAVFVVGK